MSLGLEKVRVPNAQETTENRDVLLERSLAEVLVHGVSTAEELVEVVKANVESDAQTNGTPDRVTTTDPALKAKHVLAVNAKLGHLLLVGGESNKVLGNLALVVGLLEEPLLGCVGVGGGLGSGKGLGGNEEESGLRVRLLEGLSDVCAVNVGDEVKLHVVSTVVLESFGDHDGAAIRTTDTNVDNGGELLAGVSLPLSTANLLRKLLHVLEDIVDAALCVHDINTLNLHVPTTNVSQGSVVDGAVLGEVDLLASKHGIALLLDTSLLGELDEEVEGLIVEEVLGKVEEDLGADTTRGKGAGKLVEALRVRSKGFLEDEGLANAVAVRLELKSLKLKLAQHFNPSNDNIPLHHASHHQNSEL
ncbi:hypothetical protein HG531_006706 [Fusarium graminearum]|nr:hypothetical protein HG531_006706 [Fusarium graminearum]